MGDRSALEPRPGDVFVLGDGARWRVDKVLSPRRGDFFEQPVLLLQCLNSSVQKSWEATVAVVVAQMDRWRPAC